ncbi:hypothetical protein [Sphingomonas sp. Leaf339]|uniref:hypothetical protein n=1 Tax=Sphingomonas sp. Leaf339 TaxID=1736343 RepID=UPI000AB0260D|nr:hypothetical protein [Sphingomonas sp. Leaf339]
MKRLIASGLMLLSALGTSEAQQRETDTGSHVTVPYRARITDAANVTAADRGRMVMQMFASCVLDRSSRQVAVALAESTESDQAAGLIKLANSDCLDSGEIRFQQIFLRGAIFTELYRRREAGRAGQPALVGYDLTQAAGATGKSQVYWWLMDLADCVVAKDRAAAKRFVVAPVVGAEESAALTNLTPSLGPCVTADQKIGLNRAVIKGALAEVLYRGAKPSIAAERKN